MQRFVSLAAIALVAISQPTLAQEPGDTAVLLERTETWVQNWRVEPGAPTDFDTLRSLYSTETYSSFDFGPPAEGFDSFAPAWAYYQQLLGNSPVESWRLELIGDSNVELRGDIAWTVSRVSLDGELEDGTVIDVPVARVTLIFEREGDEWRIVHEHGSVAMDLR
ncbi:nuclear transport factor 2 family protein [uncultured Roseobacter sp.]|uniref:YybH family protein n=1 Tax=uncultured Roseobacter sp. TaxID=114847 RepID=UPI0026186174|nr:nuclear transport factor 2 family protein [uncultured Roseobacter sp.]